MKLKEILSKTNKLLPYFGVAFGITNFHLAWEAKKARLEAASNENNRLLTEIANKNETIINNQAKQNEIGRLSIDASDQINNANNHTRTSKELINKLNDPNISQTERDQISSTLDSSIDQQADYLEQANSSYKKIMDILYSNSNSESNFISQSNFDFHDLFNQFNILIENYKGFLSTLELEQILSLMNLLGLIVILFCSISIVVVIYSDYLIKYLNNYFNIENKYPWIWKFIQLRQKFQWYFLRLDFFILFSTLMLLFYYNISYFLLIFKLY